MRRLVLMVAVLLASPASGQEPPQWKRELDRAYQGQQLEQLQRDLADLRAQVDVLRQELDRVKEQHASEARLREGEAQDRLPPEEKVRVLAAKREAALVDAALVHIELAEVAKLGPNATPVERGSASWSATQRSAACRTAYALAPAARTPHQQALAAEVAREVQRLRSELPP